MALYDEIPSLDLHDFTKGSESERSQFVSELGRAYENIGFVAIKNHGLTDQLTEKLYSSVRSFFSLPDEVKQGYEYPELHGQRGYVSKGKEKAKDRQVGDLKEFYHVGQPSERSEDDYPANVWPQEVPDFQTYSMQAYDALLQTGIEMLRAISLFLDLDPNYFDAYVKTGNSILRPIHYFPIENPEDVPADAVRAAAHGDINLITLLMGASADGLQVLRRDEKWIPITALPDQIVVNVGDMLERHTNGRLKSTIHRVVNPPVDQMGTSRFSIPFFMHPVSSMRLDCLPNCISADRPKQYEDVTAGAFLHERLREIGLIK